MIIRQVNYLIFLSFTHYNKIQVHIYQKYIHLMTRNFRWLFHRKLLTYFFSKLCFILICVFILVILLSLKAEFLKSHDKMPHCFDVPKKLDIQSFKKCTHNIYNACLNICQWDMRQIETCMIKALTSWSKTYISYRSQGGYCNGVIDNGCAALRSMKDILDQAYYRSQSKRNE